MVLKTVCNTLIILILTNLEIHLLILRRLFTLHFLEEYRKKKKYLYTKYKASENVNLFGETAEKSENDNLSFDNKIKYNEWSEEYMNDFIENFEENKRKKKRKTVAPLDKFMAEQ